MSWIAWRKLVQPKAKGGLGFREIRSFNMALVAKASWRILTKPDSLLSKMLRAKYCQTDGFLKCRKISNCSYAWKGILLGRDLLNRNVGWAVGNGKSISIWNDKWLSTTEQKAPYGPAAEKSMHMKVSDLINANEKEWNQSIVNHIIPQYAKEIKLIKLSLNLPEDKRIWLCKTDGNYSAKTGYFAALEAGSINFQTQYHNHIDWNKDVWALKLPPKVKNFIWKTLHEAIAVGSTLKKRQLDIDSKCKRCGAEESIPHLLWSCPYAKKVWKEAPILNLPNEDDDTPFPLLWKNLKTKIPLPPIGALNTPIAAWLVWRIWKARNNFVFNNRSQSESEIIQSAVIAAKEWTEAQQVQNQMAGCIYSKPQEKASEIVTLFTDASWKKEDKIAGTAGIFYHKDFQFESITEIWEDVSSPLMAEALAMRAGIQKAQSLGLTKMTVKSDSQILINVINKGILITEIYGVLQDLASLLSKFSSISFISIPRSANSKADYLAKEALRAFKLNCVLVE